MGGKIYMAIDELTGQTFHGLTSPRRDLLEKLCRSRAEKMYVDGEDGKTYFVGYAIAGMWLRLYEVKPVRMVVK